MNLLLEAVKKDKPQTVVALIEHGNVHLLSVPNTRELIDALARCSLPVKRALLARRVRCCRCVF
jgi:hypothetical protein